MSGSTPEWAASTTCLEGVPPTTSAHTCMAIAKQCPLLTSVDLRGVALGAQAIPVALHFVAHCPALVHVDLSATGAVCDSEIDVERLLRLPRVLLAGNKLRNAEVLCLVLARASCSVTHLDLSNNSFDERAQLLILSALRLSRNLVHLDLSRNAPVARKRASRFLDTLMRNTSLQWFDASFVGTDPAFRDYVNLMLRQNATLRDAGAGSSTQAISFNSRRWVRLPACIFTANPHTLVSLNLSDNRLAALPLDMVRLKALETLNISNNEITMDALPVHLRALPALLRFSVRGNPFVESIPSHVNWRDTADLLRFFTESSRSTEMHAARPARCIVLGNPQVGKSRLIKTLRKMVTSGDNASGTNVKLKAGLVRLKKYVQDIVIERPYHKILQLHDELLEFAPDVKYSMSELASASEYVPGHVFFMHRTDGLFVLCFSLVSPRSLLRLGYWLDCIVSKCVRPHIIIVGTNADRCSNSAAVVASLREQYAHMKSVQLHGVFAVNAQSQTSCDPLRALMLSVGQTAFRNNIMKPRPLCFFTVASILQAETDPVIPLARFFEVCDLCLVPPAMHDALLLSLRDSGVVLWYDLPALRQLMCVDVGWMVESLTSLFNATSQDTVTKAQMDTIWPSYLFNEDSRSVLLDVLEQFGLLHRLPTRNECIVPCILSSTEVPLEQVARCQSVVQRQSDMCLTLLRVFRFDSYRPPGFMAQLVARVLQMSSASLARQVSSWRFGVCCIVEDSIDGSLHCVQAAAEKDTDVLVSLLTPDVTGKTMWLVSHAIESLLRNWFPNVHYTCFIRSPMSGAEVSVESVSLALQDIRRAESATKLSNTLREYEKLAPDLLLLRTKRVELDSLTRIRKIGQGSFGVVYLASMESGERVVVKEMLESSLGGFDSSAADDDNFSSFQNEAWMLSVLEHPRIIRLIGLTMRPKRALITEWMEVGDLSDFLAGPQCASTFHWPARLSVLSDICLAMDFAHRLTPPIVHKDLKSPNVFLSVSRRRTLVAKVADLGLASWTYGGDRGVGMPDNPTWVAPEVLDRRRHAYGAIDPSVDVYSFGIMMWEVMHPGKRPFAHFTDHNNFISALADAICDGMRPEPVETPDAPDGYSALMQQCWSQERLSRGSFRIALASLGSMQAALLQRDSSKVVAYALHDLGVLSGSGGSGVLASASGVDSLTTVDADGVVMRFVLRLGRGAPVHRMPVVMRSPEMCALPSGAVMVASRDPEGGSVIMVAGSPLKKHDHPVSVEHLCGGRVLRMFRCGAYVCIIGELGNTRGEACVVLLDSTTLAPAGSVDFVPWGMVVDVTHQQTGPSEWSVWVLMDTSLIMRFSLLPDCGRIVQLEDLMLGDKEAQAEQLSFVGPSTVWGLMPDSSVVVWEGSTVSTSFAVSRAVGKALTVRPAGKEMAFIISTHAISLWSVTGQVQLGIISTHGVEYRDIAFFPEPLGGIGVAVGMRLRAFIVAPEVLSEEAIYAKRASRRPSSSPRHSGPSPRVKSSEPPGGRSPRVKSSEPPGGRSPRVKSSEPPGGRSPRVKSFEPPVGRGPSRQDSASLMLGAHHVLESESSVSVSVLVIDDTSSSSHHQRPHEQNSVGSLSSLGDSDDGTRAEIPPPVEEELLGDYDEDYDDYDDVPSDETAVEINSDEEFSTTVDTVALFARSLPKKPGLDEDLVRTGETLAQLLRQLEQQGGETQQGRESERHHEHSTATELDWSTTAGDDEWSSIAGEEWSKRSTVVLPEIDLSQHLRASRSRLSRQSRTSSEDMSHDTDDDDSIEIIPLERDSHRSDQGPARAVPSTVPPPVSASAPTPPTSRWKRPVLAQDRSPPPPPSSAVDASPRTPHSGASPIPVRAAPVVRDSQPPDLPPDLPPDFPPRRSPLVVSQNAKRTAAMSHDMGSRSGGSSGRTSLRSKLSSRSKSGGLAVLSRGSADDVVSSRGSGDLIKSHSSAVPAWKAMPLKPDAELLSGNLRVKSRLGYKMRFFEIVDEDKVLFFEKQECKGHIRISEISHIDLSQAEPEKAIFTLYTVDAVHELLAANLAEANSWVDALTKLNPAIALVTEAQRRPSRSRSRPPGTPPASRKPFRVSSSKLSMEGRPPSSGTSITSTLVRSGEHRNE